MPGFAEAYRRWREADRLKRYPALGILPHADAIELLDRCTKEVSEWWRRKSRLWFTIHVVVLLPFMLPPSYQSRIPPWGRWAVPVVFLLSSAWALLLFRRFNVRLNARLSESLEVRLGRPIRVE